MLGILGDLIFYISILDLAHTLLNFRYQPGMVAFGGREASLRLSYFGDKPTHLSGLQYGLPRWLEVRNSPASAGEVTDASAIPRSGRSPGGGNGNPL